MQKIDILSYSINIPGSINVLTILLAVFFIAFLTAMATSAQGNSNGKIIDITIQTFAFNSQSVKISAGDTVRWTTMDSADQAVAGSICKSGIIPRGQNYDFRFTEPGFYKYECSIHPSMKGTVTVVANK
jgi:plastocyanin